jgi:hypothetical protein
MALQPSKENSTGGAASAAREIPPADQRRLMVRAAG